MKWSQKLHEVGVCPSVEHYLPNCSKLAFFLGFPVYLVVATWRIWYWMISEDCLACSPVRYPKGASAEMNAFWSQLDMFPCYLPQALFAWSFDTCSPREMNSALCECMKICKCKFVIFTARFVTLSPLKCATPPRCNYNQRMFLSKLSGSAVQSSIFYWQTSKVEKSISGSRLEGVLAAKLGKMRKNSTNCKLLTWWFIKCTHFSTAMHEHGPLLQKSTSKLIAFMKLHFVKLCMTQIHFCGTLPHWWCKRNA